MDGGFDAQKERTALHITSGTTTFSSNTPQATFTVENAYVDETGDVTTGAAIDIRKCGFKANGIKYYFPEYNAEDVKVGSILKISDIKFDYDPHTSAAYPSVFFEFASPN